jgi:hypothetical protein
MTTMPPMPTRGEWVTACMRCTELFEALVRASFEVQASLHEFMQLCQHLASQHPALLPPYQDGCEECETWQLHDPDSVARLRVGDTTPGPRLVPLLGFEDLFHRARHLIYSEL